MTPWERSNQRLTRREVEVSHLLARGYAQRHIAAELVISRRTVYSHVRSICGKVGARSRFEAAVKLRCEWGFGDGPSTSCFDCAQHKSGTGEL